MKLRQLLVILLTASFAFAAAPVTIDLRLAPGEWISAALVEDDGSGVAVVARTKPRATRIVRFDANGNRSETPVNGFAINHFEPLADCDRYFVAGSVESGGEPQYVHRIIEWKRNDVRTLWDSTSLPSRLFRTDPYIRVSRDGKLWGSVADEGRTLRFVWGEIGAATPRATIRIESTPVAFPDGFVFDGTDVVMVRSYPKPLAAVLWRGRVHLVDLAAGSAADVLAPRAGGATLRFDHAANTLWVGGNEWVAFPLGPVAVQARRPEIAIPGIAPHAVVRLSPNGRVALVAPDGPLGSTIEIRRLD